ncbi:MAG: T9SS type A sorting domain-containing protein [Ignavibacteriaceae bacterium]|jgi:photosystem II stability/assembly factor-like uncharacterized protein|nr:MAG: T9SS C-terminal target domain-containing protein [Chlorobiota bacterium]MBV6398358.1 Ycf48-like protein [Ignavibacteria bacterium]MCC6886051.1 T9SS type A sorting domain-containing protein [Ignavibacteriales bacterium]MCE7952698.1 T9SS C-terminal target domain-containing protein [Chlorobi bacterium CHB7]MDL1886809.1 T9SS type A sorting domain-containing protein [Ignavibacteria bacterium CHB1]MEB2329522.1 T9SS type A sorting domain-containing protein [Ignavibacteriaceae bacterium]OQY77
MKNWLAIIIFFTTVSVTFAQGGWYKINSPTDVRLNRLYFLNENTGWVAGDSGKIYKTTDGTATWIDQSTSTMNNIYDIRFLNENTGWALAWIIDLGSYNNYGTEIISTTNGGEDWNLQEFSQPDLFLETIYFKNENEYYLGGYPGQFLKSTDAGLNWNPVVVDSSVFAFFPVLSVDYYSSTLAIASGGYIDIAGVMWKSTNNGLSWFAQAVGPEPVQDFIIFDSLNILGVGGDFEYGTGVVRSSDGGVTWEHENLNILGTASSVSFRNRNNGWMCLGFAGALLFTRDGGSTWETYYTSDSAEIYQLQFINDSTGYGVGVDGVIISFSRNPSGIETNQNIFDTDFRLYQNYPNPFNPTTAIKYYLPEKSAIKLTLYDLNGKEILTLDEGVKSQGSYIVTLNARNLSSGVYIYKLLAEHSSGIFSESKKLIHIK